MSNIKPFPNTKQTVESCACGPICLLNIYEYYKKDISLNKILKDLNIELKEQTHCAQLARHLNNNKLKTTIYSSCAGNISPDWKGKTQEEIVELLKRWVTYNYRNSWLKDALYLLFYLQEGGNIKIVDLSKEIIDKCLEEKHLILTSLDDSWLWGKRKINQQAKYDSIKGYANGHSIVIYGKTKDKYLISDSYPTEIEGKDGLYSVNKDKLLVSILLWSGQIVCVKK